MHCSTPTTSRTHYRIDFLREFEIVDPTSEDVNRMGPVVGQEHIKDFGDPFIPDGVYNGWKGNKDFEMMKVIFILELVLMVERKSRGCRGVSGIAFECCA